MVLEKLFPRSWYLKKHDQTVHEGIKSFKFNMCPESFSVRNSLVKHMESTHKTTYEPFKCSLCESIFQKRSVLREHVDSVHEGKRQSSAQSVVKVFASKLFWTNISKLFMKERNPTSVLFLRIANEKIAISALRQPNCQIVILYLPYCFISRYTT